MRVRGTPLELLLVLVALTGANRSAADDAPKPKPADSVAFGKDVIPLLKSYCTNCHGGAKPKGGMALDAFKEERTALTQRTLWENVAKNLRSGDMPPEGKKKPTAKEMDTITAWIDSRLGAVDCTQKNPGRVTIRRLNRVEYNNTIRDLLGVPFQPADDFPADDIGYGFDNIGDVLSLPPLLMEKYLAAAEKIVAAAMRSPESKRRIFICPLEDGKRMECARKIFDNFATRAYRRPAKPEELDRLHRLVQYAEQQGDDFEKGIQLGVQAILASPHFLFRIETDKGQKGELPVAPVSEFELATRLAYFLWSSMPDDELFGLAKEGKLRTPGVLESQVRRMLKDPKARALVENFAGQWLNTRNLKALAPDPKLFPSFDEALRTAMLNETEFFFEAVMKEDRSVLDFLDADFTYVNERLAKHYGIPEVKGNEFRKVKLTDDRRGGLLTQASILTVTSNPTRTSPVKRGKWILENILGTPPPPPPPDAGELSEAKEAIASASLRQRMELHRANPSCAICHARMDPLGFGFENYDAIGAWRARDGKFDIDPAGMLPGGKKFQGPKELKAILKERQADFRHCLAEKLLTYALGRGLEYYDKCAVDEITATLARQENRFNSLVLAIVNSDPFQQRRGRKGDR